MFGRVPLQLTNESESNKNESLKVEIPTVAKRYETIKLAIEKALGILTGKSILCVRISCVTLKGQSPQYVRLEGNLQTRVPMLYRIA